MLSVCSLLLIMFLSCRLIIDPSRVGRSPRDWERLRLEAGAITARSGYAAWWYAVCMFLYFIDYMTTLSAPLDHAVSRVDSLPFGLSDQNWSSTLH